MPITLHKDLLGTDRHAVVSNDMVRWSVEVDTNSFVLGGKRQPNSIEPLLSLYGVEVPGLVPTNFRKSFEACGAVNVPWKAALPKKMFIERLKLLISEAASIEKMFLDSEYPLFFIKTNRLFSMLQNSNFARPLAEAYLRKNDNHALKAIISMSKQSVLPVPTYDRVSTKTGRLTIKEGPQILTLKREFRSIFSSASSKSKLYEIDFISLEPRVALNFAGVHASNDVYLSFIQATEIKISRDAAKLAVLCSLYGAGETRLDALLRSESTDITARMLVKAVVKYFKLHELRRHLFTQAKQGLIQNYFGRPIEIDDARESILVNNYLQSSATDIAIAGFNDFAQKLNGKCRPLFVIHDALIIDVPDEHLDEVQRYVYNGYDIPGLGNFPLKLKEFDNHE